jgi:hypothetical protein
MESEYSVSYERFVLNFVAFSLQANYTNRATVLVPTFADRGCHMVSATDPHGH